MEEEEIIAALEFYGAYVSIIFRAATGNIPMAVSGFVGMIKAGKDVSRASGALDQM